MNHVPGARLITQPVDQQSSALPLDYGRPLVSMNKYRINSNEEVLTKIFCKVLNNEYLRKLLRLLSDKWFLHLLILKLEIAFGSCRKIQFCQLTSMYCRINKNELCCKSLLRHLSKSFIYLQWDYVITYWHMSINIKILNSHYKA